MPLPLQGNSKICLMSEGYSIREWNTSNNRCLELISQKEESDLSSESMEDESFIVPIPKYSR